MHLIPSRLRRSLSAIFSPPSPIILSEAEAKRRDAREEAARKEKLESLDRCVKEVFGIRRNEEFFGLEE